MRTLNFEELLGRRIRIMFSQRDPSRRKQASGNIFIKHLADDVDSKALYDTFSMFGPILSCKVATDPETGASKVRGRRDARVAVAAVCRSSLALLLRAVQCYGYVQFERDEDAQKAISKVDGMIVGSKPVSVQRYVRRTERRRCVLCRVLAPAL
jgi:polyadenylate-binding protein